MPLMAQSRLRPNHRFKTFTETFIMRSFLLLPGCFILSLYCFSQNVGIGTPTPASKLHVKGNADVSQLIIDANSTQTNANPLIKLRTSAVTELLRIHTDNSLNTFIGALTGISNDLTQGAIYNAFIGSQAGYSNTAGALNTANGYRALNLNTTGSENTAIGASALSSNTGSYNTATGTYALYVNDIGSYNTANGYRALFNNTTASNNTANGAWALYKNTTGHTNTATGVQALYSNTIGFFNTATGVQALNYNTTGSYNTAHGQGALFSNTTGSDNTANGNYALFDNTTGSNNTADGIEALKSNSTGFFNAANGYHALYYNTTGSDNTANGPYALISHTTGTYNTALGAFADVAIGNLTNATAIGAIAVVNASNKIRLGNSSITVIEGQVAFTPSDGRFKKNIKENVPGLDFISSLKPVTYQYQCFEFDKFLLGNNSKSKVRLKQSDYADAESMIRMGFIAQDVEKIIKDKGYKLSVVHTPTNPLDNYSIAYGELVVPLVKAIQEQEVIIETLQQKIEAL